MPSPSRRALAGAALGIACALAAAADLAPASPALCKPAQKVMFHCSFGAKAVSLCADIEAGRVATLGYRYGAPGRIELALDAGTEVRPYFNATLTQLAPGAAVRQVWFDHAGYTYLLSQCVGGACPYDAGLAVLRGDVAVFDHRCLRTADDRAWFSPELARFGRDAASSQSTTSLLVFDDVDNGVERLYPMRPGRP